MVAGRKQEVTQILKLWRKKKLHSDEIHKGLKGPKLHKPHPDYPAFTATQRGFREAGHLLSLLKGKPSVGT